MLSVLEVMRQHLMLEWYMIESGCFSFDTIKRINIFTFHYSTHYTFEVVSFEKVPEILFCVCVDVDRSSVSSDPIV